MGPFGYGNPEPVIGMRRMTILDKRIVGENHVRLTLSGSGKRFEAIGFQMGRTGIMESNHTRWDIVFTPKQEYWQGHSRLNLRLFDLQPS
jgi:single-stranded-DNA-specific exonuclease